LSSTDLTRYDLFLSALDLAHFFSGCSVHPKTTPSTNNTQRTTPSTNKAQHKHHPAQTHLERSQLDTPRVYSLCATCESWMLRRFQTYFNTFLLHSLLLYGTNNQTTTIASTGGPEAEFQDPRRRELLQALKDALYTEIRPTASACLWLCDIDKLEDIVAQTQAQTTYVRSFFEAIEAQARIVPTCRVTKPISPR